VVICLEQGADCLHMVQLMPLHPKTPPSLASFKSRLVLPFWCRLTQVVLEKKPLNVCGSSVVTNSPYLGKGASCQLYLTGQFSKFVHHQTHGDFVES